MTASSVRAQGWGAVPDAGTSRRLFHASPAHLLPGEVLVPGRLTGATTTGDGSAVFLARTLAEARLWGTYVGRRADLGQVWLYLVEPLARLEVRVDGRAVLPVGEYRTGRARVLREVEVLDPWHGELAECRDSLRLCPF